jgi:hypothetical protein
MQFSRHLLPQRTELTPYISAGTLAKHQSPLTSFQALARQTPLISFIVWRYGNARMRLSTCTIESSLHKYGGKRGTNPEEACLKHETVKNCELLRRLSVSLFLNLHFDHLQTSSSPTLLSSYSRSIAEVIHKVLNSTCTEKSYQ